MRQSNQHTFHIPVMGLAYTIDSPIKVARFGISSVISIVEDRLIEMMRQYYYSTINREYLPISVHETDYRAKRITDYLNLVNTIVQSQMDTLRNTAFETGSEIVKYFEMLPDHNLLKQLFRKMMNSSNVEEKERIALHLRSKIQPGRIDVNIMTKVDREIHSEDGALEENGSDAVTALRGYAKSNLTNSSVVFSAGMNPRVYNYLENCHEFDMQMDGSFSKKVIVKVSDYRSALIQGKYLAKKGIWVSEFRIESGLNCGGHAFATDGNLLGPILEEFKLHRQALIDIIFKVYNSILRKKNRQHVINPPQMTFSVQGGIGTHEEDDFLLHHYKMDSTGWGTPFLLVPQATTVDEHTMKLLCQAKEKDVLLSRNSPLGIRFHYLKGTSSDIEKSLRIKNGKPGSPCTEKYLSNNTEFTEQPICTASHKYQKLKKAQLQSLQLPVLEYQKRLKEVMEKECLCVGLSNAAALTYNQTLFRTLKAVTICPGPNIINFSEVVTLKTMIDHIYGRVNILTNADRPHMFITEMKLYIDYLKEELENDIQTGNFSKNKKYYTSFYQNLCNGIKYYRNLSNLSEKINWHQFKIELNNATFEMDALNNKYAII